ncbi:MAG: hypothetical protein DRN15_07360 [Thermoprotei archaeon]|nr:MAG: hypothetical protein DRM97_05380 [Thermoprotei archaeon]RLF23036.1 MAG: hypothetical protein DRN15_07360 [Thermoprotei archaeon]
MQLKEMGIFKRHDEPVLVPDDVYWRSMEVFNPGAFMDKEGNIVLLYRAIGEYLSYVSRIGVAISEDGVNFRYLGDEPLLYPDRIHDWMGVEDPRVTMAGGKLMIAYASLALPEPGIWPGLRRHISLVGIAEADSNDLESLGRVRKVGVILEPHPNRDAAIVEVKGKLVLLHRPETWGSRPSIWITPLNDYRGELRLREENSKVILEPEGEELKIGLGPPPVRIENEWLMIYHAVYPPMVYVAYAALLDDEFKVLSKTPRPILVPRVEWEVYGDIHHVVFPTGMVIKDDEVLLYYGAGDKVVMMAKADLSSLMSILDKHKME